ncbi:MAG: hypothetical protein KY447_10845, partial [Actinobacteria bacterium]|nr:hypothetical protein [Actinomycetota bacterium]
DDGFGNERLGVVTVRRYGFETVGVVRVDEVGEVYVRLPDGDHDDLGLFRDLAEDPDPTSAIEPPSLDW